MSQSGLVFVGSDDDSAKSEASQSDGSAEKAKGNRANPQDLPSGVDNLERSFQRAPWHRDPTQRTNLPLRRATTPRETSSVRTRFYATFSEDDAVNTQPLAVNNAPSPVKRPADSPKVAASTVPRLTKPQDLPKPPSSDALLQDADENGPPRNASFLQAALLAYIAVTAFLPLSGNALHVTVVCVTLALSASSIFVHRVLDFTAAIRQWEIATVYLWVGMTVLLSPYYVPSPLQPVSLVSATFESSDFNQNLSASQGRINLWSTVATSNGSSFVINVLAESSDAAVLRSASTTSSNRRDSGVIAVDARRQQQDNETLASIDVVDQTTRTRQLQERGVLSDLILRVGIDRAVQTLSVVHFGFLFGVKLEPYRALAVALVHLLTVTLHLAWDAVWLRSIVVACCWLFSPLFLAAMQRRVRKKWTKAQIGADLVIDTTILSRDVGVDQKPEQVVVEVGASNSPSNVPLKDEPRDEPVVHPALARQARARSRSADAARKLVNVSFDLKPKIEDRGIFTPQLTARSDSIFSALEPSNSTTYDSFGGIVMSNFALPSATADEIIFHSRGPVDVPRFVLNLDSVVQYCNGSLLASLNLDSSLFIKGRSFESILEWLDVEYIEEILHQISLISEIAAAASCSDGRLEAYGRFVLRGTGTTRQGWAATVEPTTGGALPPRSQSPDRIRFSEYVTTDSACVRLGTGTYSEFGTSSQLRPKSITPRHVWTANRFPGKKQHLPSLQTATKASSGTFAMIFDVWRISDGIIIQQPLSHAVVEALPLPAFLLDANGTILCWNSELWSLLDWSPYDVIGANAFEELLGRRDLPLRKPSNFPYVGTFSLPTGTAKDREFSYTLTEWPASEASPLYGDDASLLFSPNEALGTTSSTPRSASELNGQQKLSSSQLLCVVDRSKRTSGKEANQFKQTLHRLLEQFNKRAKTGSSKDMRSLFVDEVLAWASQMALLDEQAAGESTMPLSSHANTPREPSPPQVVAPLYTVDVPVNCWARLASQDTRVSDAFICTAPGKEFRVGRSSKECQLTVTDTMVSKVQFIVTRRPGSTATVMLTDMSANGTFVNVKKVGRGQQIMLRHGDQITFRLSNMQFFLGFVFQTVTAGTSIPRNPEAIRGSEKQRPNMTGGKIEWKIGEERLGKGGNAEVFLGINLTNGKLMAVKRVPLPKGDAKTKKQYEALQEEIKVLSVAVHPNIVQYYGASQSSSHLNILLEFVPGGSMRHMLDNFGKFEDRILVLYLRQMLAGLRYLHECGIVHGDLKCANVLVTDKAEVKISDFGTSKHFQHYNANAEVVGGTLLWMAPELIREDPRHTFASDIWSIGCCMIEMLSASVPWSEYEIESMDDVRLLLLNSDDPPDIPQCGNPVIHSLAHQCLRMNPRERPSAARLLEMLEVGTTHPTPNERSNRSGKRNEGLMEAVAEARSWINNE